MNGNGDRRVVGITKKREGSEPVSKELDKWLLETLLPEVRNPDVEETSREE